MKGESGASQPKAVSREGTDMTSVSQKPETEVKDSTLHPSPFTPPPSDTQASPPMPKKRRHGPPKQAFVLLALIVAAGAWWAYTELSAVPAGGIVASGTIESEEVNVASEVPGRITQLLVDEGDRVQEGQLLARIDDSTLQLQFRMASTEAERQLLQLQIAKTSVRSPM